MPICNKCKTEKSESEFGRYCSGSIDVMCKKCRREPVKKWWRDHPDAIRSYNRKSNNKPKTKARRKQWIANHREQYLAAIRRYSRTLREEALLRYSGPFPKCACPGCAETRREFLTIDHKNGDGADHRRQIKMPIYTWLKKQGYPPGFQVLCFNCNCAKGARGVCPHVTAPTTWFYEI